MKERGLTTLTVVNQHIESALAPKNRPNLYSHKKERSQAQLVRETLGKACSMRLNLSFTPARRPCPGKAVPKNIP